jgi:hypothetical protein
MVQNTNVHDTIPDTPRAITERPPAFEPSNDVETATAIPIEGVGGISIIGRGTAKAACVGAMLNTWHAIAEFEQIAGAILRASLVGDEISLQFEGGMECARERLRVAAALILTEARILDDRASVSGVPIPFSPSTERP